MKKFIQPLDAYRDGDDYQEARKILAKQIQQKADTLSCFIDGTQHEMVRSTRPEYIELSLSHEELRGRDEWSNSTTHFCNT